MVSTPAPDAARGRRAWRRWVMLGVVLLVTIGLVTPVLAVTVDAIPDPNPGPDPDPEPPAPFGANRTATANPTATPPESTATPATTPASAPSESSSAASTAPTPTPPAPAPPNRTPPPRPRSPLAGDTAVVVAGNGTAYDACTGKGFVWRGICNFIEDAKRTIVGGALDVTQNLIRSTLELLLRRPAPRRGGEIAVFRPPTNQPLAGGYRAWTTVGLPLGFLIWVIGVGVALASRFRPDAGFAAQGFQIEQNLVRNLLLTIGSWWVGAFILHLANGLILAVAPRGEQFLTAPEAGVGSLLAAGALVWVLKVLAAVVAAILFVASILAYFLCLTFMGYLSVFSALLLFDTEGVLQTIGWFGKKGWDIFIRAAFFPFPAALVLGAGTYIANGTAGFVEQAVGIAGFAAVAETLAFTAVMFVTLVTALLASLWMIMGARGASTAAGVLAGLGGAALFSRAKLRAKRLGKKTSLPNLGSSTSTAGSATGSVGGATGSRGATPRGGALGAGGGPDPAGALGAGSRDTDTGGLTPMGVPTGGRPRSTGSTSRSTTGGSADIGTGVGAGPGTGDIDDPIVVGSEGDLPTGQDYKPGYVSGGEFQPVVPSEGRKREMVIREYDRFADAYDSEGDHAGVYLRGEEDGRLYDASAVAGENWGLSLTEEAGLSRDAVFDARNGGRESR